MKDDGEQLARLERNLANRRKAIERAEAALLNLSKITMLGNGAGAGAVVYAATAATGDGQSTSGLALPFFLFILGLAAAWLSAFLTASDALRQMLRTLPLSIETVEKVMPGWVRKRADEGSIAKALRAGGPSPLCATLIGAVCCGLGLLSGFVLLIA